MSVWWDYVSELRSPTGILFIPQVIYEYGERWWNSVDRWKFLIFPPEICGSSSSSHLVPSKRKGRREYWIWSWDIFVFILVTYHIIYNISHITNHISYHVSYISYDIFFFLTRIKPQWPVTVSPTFKGSSKGSFAFWTTGHHLSRNTAPVHSLQMLFPVIPVLLYVF
jgi:hypothetical protein